MNPIINSIILAWSSYLTTAPHWQELIHAIPPRQTDCGMVYELVNPIDRPNESFAIVNMRSVKVSTPHYHINDEVEIYFVLQGTGIVVVGGKEEHIQKDSIIVTPSNIAHFIIPFHDLVLAVVNTPPFNPSNAINLTQTDKHVGFDQEQFVRLCSW